MITRLVDVTVTVLVELDETKFTPDFMQGFSEALYPFDSLDDHVKHIAQLEARGLLNDFTEGYGTIKDMGIKADSEDVQIEVLAW